MVMKVVILEKDAVLNYVSQLPQQEYTATIYRTLNQVNNPPIFSDD